MVLPLALAGKLLPAVWAHAVAWGVTVHWLLAPRCLLRAVRGHVVAPPALGGELLAAVVAHAVAGAVGVHKLELALAADPFEVVQEALMVEETLVASLAIAAILVSTYELLHSLDLGGTYKNFFGGVLIIINIYIFFWKGDGGRGRGVQYTQPKSVINFP